MTKKLKIFLKNIKIIQIIFLHKITMIFLDKIRLKIYNKQIKNKIMKIKLILIISNKNVVFLFHMIQIMKKNLAKTKKPMYQIKPIITTIFNNKMI